jgi:hypothetical protein
MSQYGTIDTAFAGMKAEHYQYAEVLKSACAKQVINFGEAIFSYLGERENVYNYKLDTAKVVFAGDFGATDAVTFTVNGQSTSSVVFTTDHNTTMNLLIAAIRGLSITDSVLGTVSVDAALDPSDGTNRTIFIRTKGLDNTTSMADDAGTPPAETITYQSDQVFRGMARHKAKYTNLATNTNRYELQDTVSIVEKGFYWGVINNVTVLSEQVCNIDNAGADKGNFTNASGDTINCVFRSDNYTQPTLGGYLAIIELRGVVKLNAEIVWT